MQSLVDRVVLLISCLIFLLMEPRTTIGIIVFLVALSVSALNIAFSNTMFEKALCIFYVILCMLHPYFCIFIPLILYDTFWHKEYIAIGLNAAMLLWYLSNSENSYSVFLLFLAALSFLLMRKTDTNEKLSKQYKELRDTSKELSILLENKNRDLIEKQDYEIHLATLKERNRIAREIHDNVGHLLSRSILMMGATIAMNRDEKLIVGLDGINTTLSSAMDNIRQSVHDLHDESIDLEAEIKRLVSEFRYCPISYEYDMEKGANRILKYCFITIIKEALSNVMKHSNATRVHIIVREHPGLYQLLIQDDGTKRASNSAQGIGLENMRERVSNLKGTILISNDNGFRIFISVPKQSLEK